MLPDSIPRAGFKEYLDFNWIFSHLEQFVPWCSVGSVQYFKSNHLSISQASSLSPFPVKGEVFTQKMWLICLENTQNQQSRLFPKKTLFLSSAPDKSLGCDEMQLLLIFNVRTVCIHFLRGKPGVTGVQRRCSMACADPGFAAAAAPVPKGQHQLCLGSWLNGSFWIKAILTPISPKHHQTHLNLHVDKSPDLRFVAN